MNFLREELVEIYSDEPNKVVLRVPWRRYPGIHIQGDELSTLSSLANTASSALRDLSHGTEPTEEELRGRHALFELIDELQSLLRHYNNVTRVYTPQ
jgi:hypothetical protein